MGGGGPQNDVFLVQQFSLVRFRLTPAGQELPPVIGAPETGRLNPGLLLGWPPGELLSYPGADV
ncbi:hypothetical protein GCM10025871_21260 [Deinococcus metallilatus]|nr:hypothetical protein GCM10025871_21260 [Deinococcus metallilatus]